GCDDAADLDERLRAGARSAVERADHRRRDLMAFRRRLGRRLGLRLDRLGLRLRELHRVEGEAPPAGLRVSADPQRILSLGDFDLRDARLLEQLDQFLYLANIHYLPPPARKRSAAVRASS